VSQYPIPHGKHYEPCTLRRRYMVSQICHGADKQNALKVVPLIKGKQTISLKRAHIWESTANGKNSANPKLKHP
jgi:hypothetical protein